MGELVKTDQSSGGLVKYTPEEFVMKYSPATIEKEHTGITSVVKAINADTNSIALARKNIGEQAVVDAIVLHLVKICQSINVNIPLTGIQIKELAREIISVYYNISIVEVAYVFRRAKRGDFGKIGSYALNQEDVITWFHKYNDERCTEFQKAQEKEHHERINGRVEMDEDGNYMTVLVDEFAQGRSKIFGKLKESLPPNPEDEFKRYKKQIEEQGVEYVDTDHNEELQKMKKQLEQQYGIE